MICSECLEELENCDNCNNNFYENNTKFVFCIKDTGQHFCNSCIIKVRIDEDY